MIENKGARKIGPGSYNQPSYLGEGPKYTMGDKRETGP